MGALTSQQQSWVVATENLITFEKIYYLAFYRKKFC